MTDLLTKKQAAAYWQVGMRTISRWMAQGRVQVVSTPGGKPRIRINPDFNVHTRKSIQRNIDAIIKEASCR